MQLEYGGRRVAVSAADLVIGSDPTAALVVEGLGVLPRHALVRIRPDGSAEVAPAQPGAFLLLNGARVGPQPATLSAGDRLVVGDREIHALDPEAPVGASQRLNVTMMGIPAVPPGMRPQAPAPGQPTPPATAGGRPVGRVVLAVVVMAILAYLFLLRG